MDKSPVASSSEPQLDEASKQPAEAKAGQPRLKPKMRTNMVAREVRVNVAGVQRGKTAGERELFTEETSSMLVHENGGVIQLSGVVLRGQLLVLTNVESKRQVAAQVKRTYQPMNRCVELEFAEISPRFWGMEFSAATALLPKSAKDAEAAALISAKASPDEQSGALPAPSFEEVEALKRDVRALREGRAPVNHLEVAHDPVGTDLTPAEQELLPKPALDFSMPLPKSGLFRARGKFMPGAKLRLAVLAAALIVTAAGATWLKQKISPNAGVTTANTPVVSGNISTSVPPATREVSTRELVVREHSKFNNPGVASGTQSLPPSVTTQPEKSPARPVVSSGVSAPAEVKRTSPGTTLAAAPVAKARVRPPAQITSEAVGAAPAGEGVIVPPKLIQSVRAVASLDDLRDFETGNVIIDAVVDTEGEVKFISVISGPPSLRPAAIKAVKQYRYQPATRNGQAVPEHVHITIRFHFES